MSKDDFFQINWSEENLNYFSEDEVNTEVSQNPTAKDILAEIRGEPVTHFEEPEKETQEPFLPPESVLENKIEEIELESDSITEIPDEAQSPPPQTPSEDLYDIKTSIELVEQDVKTLTDSSAKITAEVREMHKLYHNEYADRLKSMQDELERYREIDKGRIFDNILSEVAKLYSDYESILGDINEEKIKKRICYMLEDIVQILEANGVCKQKSKQGDKRNTRHCRVIERILTNSAELHDTVVLSRGTGFYIENRSLIKEPVDIYLYSEKTDDKSDKI